MEGDKIDEIINAHSETVDALKKERDEAKEIADGYKADADKLKAEADKIPKMQKEIDRLKKSAEENAEKNGENAWKVKYEAMKEERDKLKGEFDSYKTDISAKELKATKDKAYRSLLKEVGVSEKRIDVVMRVTNLDSVELDEEGNIKDASEVKKSIKEDWADFIPTTVVKGADTATPPSTTKGSAVTKESIMAIKDRAERQKAIAENPEIFGIDE